MKNTKNTLLNLFVLSTLASSSLSAMTIDLDLGRELTQNQRRAFREARNKWQQILLHQDLPKAQGNNGYDIVIKADAIEIDGPGRILGQAGPTLVRPGSHIPSQAIMKFDAADLEEMEYNGTLEKVIVHEMSHALGFGTIWDYLNLTNDNARNPLFIGENAKIAYRLLRSGERLFGVPLENMGGPGTAGSHWRKSRFGNELMTGSINSADDTPVSVLTIAAFQDMGYRVDYAQAEPYFLPFPQQEHERNDFRGTSHHASLTHTCGYQTICPENVYYSEIKSNYNKRFFSNRTY